MSVDTNERVALQETADRLEGWTRIGSETNKYLRLGAALCREKLAAMDAPRDVPTCNCGSTSFSCHACDEPFYFAGEAPNTGDEPGGWTLEPRTKGEPRSRASVAPGHTDLMVTPESLDVPDEAECTAVAAQLYRLAEWFDDPNASPPMATRVAGEHYAPGYLLRRICDALSDVECKIKDTQSKGGDSSDAESIHSAPAMEPRSAPASEAQRSAGADDITEAVLRVVALKPGIRATRVAKELESDGVKSYDVREAIWSLLDDGLLLLTTDWLLYTSTENETSDLSAGACHITEYDGAFKCWTHNRVWGAVPFPDELCAGWPTPAPYDEAALREALRAVELNPLGWKLSGNEARKVLDVVRPHLRPVVTEAQVREALLKYEAHGAVQWYISEDAIDCDAGEFFGALRDLGLIGGEE
jgi:hypothetical protein